MKKWMLCILAAILICLSACGNTGATTPNQTTQATESTPPTETTEETSPPPPQKITGERIVDGRSRCTAVYTYDDEGRVIRIERTHDSDGTIYNYEIFEYNGRGNIIKEEKWLTDEFPFSRTSYTYDENGILIRINNEKAYDAVWNWYEACYDDQGRVEKYIIKEKKKYQDMMVGEILFQYDPAGQLIRREEYNSNQSLVACMDYTYNENGQPTQVETHTYDTNFDTRTVDIYEYNEYGQCISLIHEIYSDELPFSTVKTAYIWE